MSVLVLFNELKFFFAFERLIGHGCSPPLKEQGWTVGGKGQNGVYWRVPVSGNQTWVY